MRAFLFATALSVSTCAAGLVTAAHAADNDAGIYGVYGSLGSEGIGVGLSFYGRPGWNLRTELNYLTTNRDRVVDGTNYKLDINHISQSVLYDYRPYQGDFRLTTGVGINQSRLDFNGRVFNSPQTPIFGNNFADVRGRIELPPVMPYVGVGMGLGKTRSGIGFYADLGAYIGSPRLKSFETQPQGTDANQARRDLEEELRSIKFYPVGKIGINYQF